MVRLCVGGGHTETMSGGGSGGVDLSVRSLDATGNLKGEFKVNKSNAEGLVNGIDNALSQVAADQADKVRTCLQPVRDRLLDVLLPLPPPVRQTGPNSDGSRITGDPRMQLQCCDAFGRVLCSLKQPLPWGDYCFCDALGIGGPGIVCR